MHRSSESVAALATALAKAQGELVNPEKSLVATIYTDRRGELERTFRYAPLSSGLEIIRKTLGRHEIATVQTTAIDQATGMVNLTTVLAHASGEWIASDWPVCPLSDTATPRRMGAALTYARRYALFTLVGIAGEDDIDAPDLDDGIDLNPKDGADQGSQANGSMPKASGTGRHVAAGHARKPMFHRPKEILDTEKSAVLRDQLLSELTGLMTSEEATAWARSILKVKNSLTSADAKLIENAFESKVAEIIGVVAPKPSSSPAATNSRTNRKRRITARPIDKSKIRFGEPRRLRNKAHLKFVATQSCAVCGRQPSDAHHLRFAQQQALGRKVSDEFTVPLCRSHHRELHRSSNEVAWWKATKIDPLAIACKLWGQTHATPGFELADDQDFRTKPKIYGNGDQTVSVSVGRGHEGDLKGHTS
jgi:hypothetical protein